jgi:hypothetical protein
MQRQHHRAPNTAPLYGAQKAEAQENFTLPHGPHSTS